MLILFCFWYSYYYEKRVITLTMYMVTGGHLAFVHWDSKKSYAFSRGADYN